MNRAELARFTRHYRVAPGPLATDCWLWQGPFMRNLYGDWHGTAAHRASYQHYVGPIPDDRPQLDHLCRRRNCVNPRHLEPVTGSLNTLRQDHAERRKTHCPRGHEYTPENTMRRNGRRFCRECDRQRKRRP